ncbi:hypothetical protein [Okeania sp. KiyG1]|uniref:hypothetical protein n=1 Tax=Okeania sp. KiyG1 TaxID=2720165 RepID=UPI001F3C67A4|nr:hypothetical protein [Okeania sp. KiyG1]
MFADKTGAVYPDELQPQLNPTVNTFYYRQLSRLDNLFQITGSYVARNIQQIPVATLNDYNTANGTTFTQETMEKLILPITNGNSTDVPLTLAAEHEWRNLDNGSVIEWLEPFAAAWRATSKYIDFKYQKGQYATLFGNTLEWDIKVSFQGLVHLTNEEVAALAGG